MINIPNIIVFPSQYTKPSNIELFGLNFSIDYSSHRYLCDKDKRISLEFSDEFFSKREHGFDTVKTTVGISILGLSKKITKDIFYCTDDKKLSIECIFEVALEHLCDYILNTLIAFFHDNKYFHIENDLLKYQVLL